MLPYQTRVADAGEFLPMDVHVGESGIYGFAGFRRDPAGRSLRHDCERKAFFFEKKNQKTFTYSRPAVSGSRPDFQKAEIFRPNPCNHV